MKKKADKAFNIGDFRKAHKYYSKALELEPTNYGLVACQIGASINMGTINNELLASCDYLISLDPSKAQVFFLTLYVYLLIDIFQTLKISSFKT